MEGVEVDVGCHTSKMELDARMSTVHLGKGGDDLGYETANQPQSLNGMIHVEQWEMLAESLHQVLRVVSLIGFMVSSRVGFNFLLLFKGNESLKVDVGRL
ncbi:hypothetical protein TSUD_218850 [Trifolium subterraneum]|uniref:Uncharacterized protein n=1 Tax=Trifolium subterraneum TaxID=3900 RepID=A0A2Z6MHU1_TRISU|nr:hypothetical protein TSUD_218850 [Trifolium subterraneum]